MGICRKDQDQDRALGPLMVALGFLAARHISLPLLADEVDQRVLHQEDTVSGLLPLVVGGHSMGLLMADSRLQLSQANLKSLKVNGPRRDLAGASDRQTDARLPHWVSQPGAQ